MAIVHNRDSHAEKDYRALYQALRRKASWNDGESIPFQGVELYNLAFTSRNEIHLLGQKQYRCDEHDMCFEAEEHEDGAPDCEIRQNVQFRYPLLCRSSRPPRRRHKRVTILLHGLNERTFAKYLPWAHELCLAGGAPVLLFPLAFHVNRVLPSWAGDQTSILERRRQIPDNQFAHRFNTVISDRLERCPQRFFWGAVQSYRDLADLTREIRSGRHPHFEADARVDFLGYSAGGYISFLLLLEDGEGLFTDSRAALFASCVPARNLNLASPLILDMAAETALMNMFVKRIDIGPDARIRHWFEHHGEGRWFRTLSGVRMDRQKLETRLRQLAPRILGIANTNDDVMPLDAVLDTLQGLRRDTGIRVLELELGLHENPFVDLGGDRLARRGLIDFLDEERFGAEFRRFIDSAASHLA
jgi:hypothetical protein